MRLLLLLLTLDICAQKTFAQFPDLPFSLPLRHLELTSSFGNRIHPISGEWKMHYGIDLSARRDTVFCVLNGVVSQIGYDPLLGIYIRVVHDKGIQTTYGHLRSPWVIAQDTVTAGQPIGITGATGKVTGEHLHFGLRINGVAGDPLEMLRILSGLNKPIH